MFPFMGPSKKPILAEGGFQWALMCVLVRFGVKEAHRFAPVANNFHHL